MARDNTSARCLANGIHYEPIVFTAQGGCHPKAEEVISHIAKAVSEAEGTPLAQMKTEIMEAISVSIARSMARSVARRIPTSRSGPPGLILRKLAEAQLLEEGGD